MGILRFIILMYFFMGFSSCSNSSFTNDDIDSFISKYQNVKFSNFKGVSITLRDSDFGDNIYMVAKQGGKFAPYIVHFDKDRKVVNSIDNKLLLQRGGEDYFSEKQIKDLMVEFENYNVCNLSVDDDENVFITPVCGANNLNLLRLNRMTNEKVVKKGNVYELHKGNWYVNHHNK